MPNCGKLFMNAEFVRKHVATKHRDLIDHEREKATDRVYENNYMRHAQAAEETGPRAARPSGSERDGARRGGGWRAGDGGRPRRHRDVGGFGLPFMPVHQGGAVMLPPPPGMEGGAFSGAFAAPAPTYVDLDAALAAAPPARAVLDYGDL